MMTKMMVLTLSALVFLSCSKEPNKAAAVVGPQAATTPPATVETPSQASLLKSKKWISDTYINVSPTKDMFIYSEFTNDDSFIIRFKCHTGQIGTMKVSNIQLGEKYFTIDTTFTSFCPKYQTEIPSASNPNPAAYNYYFTIVAGLFTYTIIDDTLTITQVHNGQELIFKALTH